MKKVSELTGAELDYWVGKADGMPVCIFDACLIQIELNGNKDWDDFAPSADWARGGPIIERERISILPFGQDIWGAGHFGDTFVRYHECNEREVDSIGPTPLIAAMRAYVASKYGYEVPNE